jgi:cysteine synthase B
MGHTSNMTQSSDNFEASYAAEAGTLRPGQSLLERIGNTPLLRFDQLTAHLPGVTLLGKAEWQNPGGSVKDRAAANIVAEGRRSGKFSSGKILLDGAIRMARELAAKHPDLYFYADQYSNDSNWLAHYHGTASEIWQQTEGRITHFVAMLGTSGTFMGNARRLKELNPAIRCISLQPDSAFHGIEGAKHMASAIVPKIYDPALADENIEIATEDAHAMARRLARECGLLLGISAAAGIAASLRIAERVQESQERKQQQAVIVTILCDSGEKYLSERFWTEG